VLPYLVAGAIALLVAGFEQAAQFGLRKLVRSWTAALWWAVRLGSEVGVALLVLGIADQLGWLPADEWYGGLIVVAATSAGLRSTFIDLPDQSIGVAPIFDKGRRFIAERLQNVEAVDTTAYLNDNVFPALAESTLTPKDIGKRLETFINVNANLPEAQKVGELDFVRDTVNDDATDQEERNAALAAKALDLGGDALVDSIVQAAKDPGE